MVYLSFRACDICVVFILIIFFSPFFQASEDEESGEENTKVHPLEKLQEKLELHLMELPVLGFNSGKYDINAAKNPFFAHLVKHEKQQPHVS